MQSLVAGELDGRPGEPAVSDENDDVASVDGSAGAVEDLQVRGTDRGPGQSVPAVFALDDPPPPERIGCLHIRTVVPGTADLHGIRAPVTVHQIPNRVLELPMMQRVQLRQGVPKPLRPHAFPLDRPLPPDHPDSHHPACEQHRDDRDPWMGGEEPHHARQEQPHEKNTATDEDKLLTTCVLA